MTLAASLARIETHVIAAGTALSPIMPARRGTPIPKGRCIRMFYVGDGDSPAAGERTTVDGGQMLAEFVRIVAYWPLSTLGEDNYEAIEDELIALKYDLKDRLIGDPHLSNDTDALVVGDADAPVITYGGGLYRVLDIECTLTFMEAH